MLALKHALKASSFDVYLPASFGAGIPLQQVIKFATIHKIGCTCMTLRTAIGLPGGVGQDHVHCHFV